MHHRERLLIYGALAALLVLNLAAFFGEGGRATADPLTETTLGPADTLTLVGEGTGPELVLRNRGGRLAWADDAWSRALSIGFVHVGRAVGPLLESEENQEEYQQLEAEMLARAQEIEDRIGAFLQEHQDVQPDDPEAGQIQQAYGELLREREQWQVEGRTRLGKLAARQIEASYREFLAAVEVVADRRGVDVVLRFIPADLDFDAVNPAQAYTGIRGRLALKYPESLDLTDDVIEELGLELE